MSKKLSDKIWKFLFVCYVILALTFAVGMLGRIVWDKVKDFHHKQEIATQTQALYAEYLAQDPNLAEYIDAMEESKIFKEGFPNFLNHQKQLTKGDLWELLNNPPYYVNYEDRDNKAFYNNPIGEILLTKDPNEAELDFLFYQCSKETKKVIALKLLGDSNNSSEAVLRKILGAVVREELSLEDSVQTRLGKSLLEKNASKETLSCFLRNKGPLQKLGQERLTSELHSRGDIIWLLSQGPCKESRKLLESFLPPATELSTKELEELNGNIYRGSLCGRKIIAELKKRKAQEQADPNAPPLPEKQRILNQLHELR
jgi:hypothetical protein